MDISEALQRAAKQAGWTPTKIAAEVGVSEASARAWLKGSAEPRVAQYRLLCQLLPLFAELVNGVAA